MKRIATLVCLLLFCTLGFLKGETAVAISDKFPSGQQTPEGAACDFARAFMRSDSTLYARTCLPPTYDAGDNGATYKAFLNTMTDKLSQQAQLPVQPPDSPRSIARVFKARHLTKDGPASYGYALFGFLQVQFVDVDVTLNDGQHAQNRVLVVQRPDEKWYVHPLPLNSPYLSDGLDSEPPSTQEFTEASKNTDLPVNGSAAVAIRQKVENTYNKLPDYHHPHTLHWPSAYVVDDKDIKKVVILKPLAIENGKATFIVKISETVVALDPKTQRHIKYEGIGVSRDTWRKKGESWELSEVKFLDSIYLVDGKIPMIQS